MNVAVADAFMAIFDLKRVGRVVFAVEIPIRAVSLANQREHWARRAKRAKEHRRAGYLATKAHALPLIVILTRIGKRKLDGDNLQGALKSVRDGVADRLGIDDANPLVRWEYAQEIGKGYAVRIEYVEPNLGG